MTADPRFPIGKWEKKTALDPATRRRFIDEIASTPAAMRRAVAGLSEAQLDTPYRDGGWTVRQVVHHLPDSHLNSYIRFKLALTEDTPQIKTYDEQKWAETAEVQKTPIEVSLTLLDALHTRWVTLLRSVSDADFARRIKHPDLGEMTLDTLLSLYAWHGRHHVAHITALRQRNAW